MIATTQSLPIVQVLELFLMEQKDFGIRSKPQLPPLISSSNYGRQKLCSTTMAFNNMQNKTQIDNAIQCLKLIWYNKNFLDFSFFSPSQRIPKFFCKLLIFLIALNKMEIFHKVINTDIWFTQNCKKFNVPFKMVLGV